MNTVYPKTISVSEGPCFTALVYQETILVLIVDVSFLKEGKNIFMRTLMRTGSGVSVSDFHALQRRQ